MRVGTVGKGADVERNLPGLQVEVPPFRIREPDEAAEEAREHRIVVVEELGEDVDVVLDGGVGKEANARGVEGVLPVHIEVDARLVRTRDIDEVEIAREVDRPGRGARAARRDAKETREHEHRAGKANGRSSLNEIPPGAHRQSLGSPRQSAVSHTVSVFEGLILSGIDGVDSVDGNA